MLSEIKVSLEQDLSFLNKVIMPRASAADTKTHELLLFMMKVMEITICIGSRSLK